MEHQNFFFIELLSESRYLRKIFILPTKSLCKFQKTVLYLLFSFIKLWNYRNSHKLMIWSVVLDPFVLEHVPNFVDVSFAQDVVNRLKERSTEKNRLRAITRLKLTAKDSFWFFAPRIKCELYCNSISMIMMLNQVENLNCFEEWSGTDSLPINVKA